MSTPIIKERKMKRKSNQKKRELLFGTYAFRKGINVTVRRGLKWFGASGVYKAKPTDERIKDSTDIIILGTDIYKCSEMPAITLRWEHDPKCCCFDGLVDAMREAYGDDFNIFEYVTVIYFVLRSEFKEEEKK